MRGLVLTVSTGALIWASLMVPVAQAQEESPYVRMLKGGAVPADRQGTLVDMIGKRGNEADLAFLLERIGRPDGFAPAVRAKALDALTEAAITRKAKPNANLDALKGVLDDPKVDLAARVAGARLAGLWKVAEVVPSLRVLAEAPATVGPLRDAALVALAATKPDVARPLIKALTDPSKPYDVRVLAVAALAKLDGDEAAALAAGLLRDAPNGADVQPMMAALLARQDGAALLAAAVNKSRPSADAAKLGLRAIYALGRADAELVGALSRAAGLDAEVKPLDQAAMDALIAEVAAQGDPARGETIFRRADLNCARCHALGQAGGGIGPDLSPIGGSSPVDYIINAILVPDQAIKEEYHTLLVLTTEGQVVQGIIVDRDEKRTVLKEATGELRTIAADSIEDSKEGGSLMPKGLSNLMTRGELVDLVRFLSELGKPGPYAVPTTPVVMRWRVRKGDSDTWANAYAKVGGIVPLDEFTELAGGPTITMRGEIDVSVEGPVQVRLSSPEGVQARLGERDLSGPMTVDLPAGRQTLTLTVDTRKHAAKTLKVEVARPEGSTTEFTVVGGK